MARAVLPCTVVDLGTMSVLRPINDLPRQLWEVDLDTFPVHRRIWFMRRRRDLIGHVPQIPYLRTVICH
jgi:hypothetical protein